MQALLLVIYILSWPLVSVAVVALIWVAVGRDIQQRRRSKEDVV